MYVPSVPFKSHRLIDHGSFVFSEALQTAHYRASVVLAEHSGAVLLGLPAAKTCVSQGILLLLLLFVYAFFF